MNDQRPATLYFGIDFGAAMIIGLYCFSLRDFYYHEPIHFSFSRIISLWRVLDHPNVSLKALEGRQRLFPILAYAIRLYSHSSWYTCLGYSCYYYYCVSPYWFYHLIHPRSCVACPKSWYKRAQSLTCIFPATSELWSSALFPVDYDSDYDCHLWRTSVYHANYFASAILSDFDYASLIDFRCYGSAFKFWIRG